MKIWELVGELQKFDKMLEIEVYVENADLFDMKVGELSVYEDAGKITLHIPTERKEV